MFGFGHRLQTNTVIGGGFVGPLDAYTTGLAGVWSVARRLLSSYEGPLIRVRRSSDDAEQDIGYDTEGALDEAGLLSFTGAGDGFVTTVYDEFGSTDKSNATASTQPKIVSSGVVEVDDTGRPAALFDGTDDTLGANDYIVYSAASLIFRVQNASTKWQFYGNLRNGAGVDYLIPTTSAESTDKMGWTRAFIGTTVTCDTALSNGVSHLMGGSLIANGNCRFYLNGAQDHASPVTVDCDELATGWSRGDFSPFHGHYQVSALWTSTLSAAQQLALAAIL